MLDAFVKPAIAGLAKAFSKAELLLAKEALSFLGS
jgi:hypothetical protein